MSMIVRNVNEAFSTLRGYVRDLPENWREIAPRGMKTLEWRHVFITEYTHPCERVLFDPIRDANPFFHFFEALWILAGRRDVAFLQQFNSNIASFSDDGETFHGAYGDRIKRYQACETGWGEVAQLSKAIHLLTADHDTRQVVISIWNPSLDLGAKTKDLPCNALLMLKIRDGALNITVCCRSNDAVWGAYGANVVQFSTLQEFIARAVGVDVGTYTQVSDSFHIYVDRPDFEKNFSRVMRTDDPYTLSEVKPFPLINGTPWQEWLRQCEAFCSDVPSLNNFDKYFTHVAGPLYLAWKLHKDGSTSEALECVEALPDGVDWKTACYRWLERRVK